MAFDFPASPTTGQTYTDATSGIVYTFDGVVWTTKESIAVTSPYVKKAGDAMLGFLSLVGPPTAALHATPKDWVEQLVAQESLFQGVWNVASNQPDLTPATMNPLHSYSWIAQTVDPSIPEIADAALPGIGGKAIAATDTVIWNNTLQLYEHIRGAVSVSQMLINDAPPAVAFHGQQWWDSDNGKHYVYYDDGTSQAWVQTSGGGGATKAEVYFGDVAPDPTFSGELWWDTATGNMMINQAGTWVQTNVEEAPVDGTGYVRQDAAWVNSAASALPPAVTTNVVWEAGWTGTMSFRYNATMVTVSLHNVKNSAALTGTAPDVKICGYPAGVTAPWTTITSGYIKLCSDDNNTPTARHVMIRAKADGIYVGLFAGAASEDTVANDHITGSLSWAI